MNRMWIVGMFVGVVLLGVVSLGVGATPPRADFEDQPSVVAYSLHAAQLHVEQAVSRRDNWRTGAPGVVHLGGITKPWAIVIDRQSGDVILVGERDRRLPPLTLDDLAVALRCRFRGTNEDPGVTIEPVGDPKTATGQRVRFFCGIDRTRFAEVCFRSDWLMKKIGLKIERIPVSSLKLYYDLSVVDAENRGAKRWNVGSRFWFFPIVTRVHVFADLVVLEKFQMGVFTQLLYAEVNGAPVADLDSFEHSPSDEFARSFSENYNAVAREHAELEALRGLTRLAALAKGLTRIENLPPIDYLLRRYPVDPVEIPSEVPVLRVEDRRVGLEISGGVTLSALVMRAREGDPDALKALVQTSRPSPNSVTWDVFLSSRDPSGLVVLPSRSESSDVGQLYAQGEFLFQQHRYDLAIAAWRQVVRSIPEAADVYFKIGHAFERKGQRAAAVEYYNRGLALEPFGQNLKMP